ncbi:MAG: dTMP kinase [Candidatus Pacebacteria bacterium CG10_big_fil_rev_8_21_14_0_10_56_10]|nr:MAG: dTMP kinase [Candidatus Pacebacteria bacterium CG10_big_fil_rev_8_21_14_0_10_56_10]
MTVTAPTAFTTPTSTFTSAATIHPRLISFEGMEGVGKTTQCQLLTDKLRDQGHQVTYVREPGGVPISEQVRQVVLTPDNARMDIRTEVLLFQAARAQLYAELVLPSLEGGHWVIMDRTRDSSTVYQGVMRQVGVDRIEQLNDFSTRQTLPSLTLLLDVPAEVGAERLQRQGDLDRIEQEGIGVQRQVRQGYLEMADRDSTGRWHLIDGTQPIEVVEKQVWQIFVDRFPDAKLGD